MNRFSLILIIILFGCVVQKQPIFVTDYLVFDTEKQVEQAQQLFFEAGIELGYDYAVYNDHLVWIIELQNISILDYEYKDGDEWKRFFPESYKDRLTCFEIILE